MAIIRDIRTFSDDKRSLFVIYRWPTDPSKRIGRRSRSIHLKIDLKLLCFKAKLWLVMYDDGTDNGCVTFIQCCQIWPRMSGFLSNKNPREGKMFGDFQDIIYWVNELISSIPMTLRFVNLLFYQSISESLWEKCFFQLVSDVFKGKFFRT